MMRNVRKGAMPFVLGFLMCFLMFTIIGCDESISGYTEDEIELAVSDALPEYVVDEEGVSEMLYSINDDDDFVEYWINYLSDNGYVYEHYDIVDMVIDNLPEPSSYDYNDE